MFPVAACAADKRRNRPSRPDAGDATATVSGIANRGSLLTCTFNNDDPEGVAIAGPTYQWIRGANTVIGGASSSTYTSQIVDIGSTIKCRVSYTDYLGFAEVIDSNSTSAIQPVDTGNGTATVTGSITIGATLTCTFNNNDPDGAAIAGPTYQWVKNGVDIGGATASTYVILLADAGASIKCRVGYTDGSGFVENVDSNTVTAASDDGDATASLSGTTQQGQTLTCTFNNNDPDGSATGITYQWFRNTSTSIGGATSSTYLLTGTDVGGTVRCRVNYTDGQGYSESIFTANSGVISSVTPGTVDTYDSGSGTHIVKSYNTMRVEVWGPGCGGDSSDGNGATGVPIHPSAPGNSTVSTLGLTGGGGQPATGGTTTVLATGGAGGTASGGNVANTSGGAGGSGQRVPGELTISTSGAGGAGANGGAGGVGATNGVNAPVHGNPGTSPGGGGSGAAFGFSNSGSRGHAGGGGGSYCCSDYTLGAGGPAVGAGLSYAVAAGGAGAVGNAPGGARNGGAGAHGRVRFTVLS